MKLTKLLGVDGVDEVEVVVEGVRVWLSVLGEAEGKSEAGSRELLGWRCVAALAISDSEKPRLRDAKDSEVPRCQADRTPRLRKCHYAKMPLCH